MTTAKIEFSGAENNRLAADRFGRRRQPAFPAWRWPDAPRLGRHGTARRRGRHDGHRGRPARPWRKRMGGERQLHLRRFRGRRDGRLPAVGRAVWKSTGGGGRLAGRAGVADRRAQSRAAHRRAGAGRHHAAHGPRRSGESARLHGRAHRRRLRYAGGGGAGDRPLSAASQEAGLARRPQQEPPPAPRRALPLALGPGVHGRGAQHQCRHGGADGRGQP